MNSLLVILVSVASALTHASGNRVGNGGDVVDCPGKIVLLDFYETTLPQHPVASDLGFEAIAHDVLKNLERLSPAQARQYQNRLKEFLQEADFKSDVKLVNIRDSKHLFKPKQEQCKVRQIAIRKKDASSISKRFLVDQELWDRLPEIDKAGLVLHEIVYEHFYKLGEDDSVKARSLTAYLFSQNIRSAKSVDYWKVIREMKLPLYQQE